MSKVKVGRAALWTTVIASCLCLAGPVLAKPKVKPPEPATLFSLKAKKPIESLNLIGDKGDLVFLSNRAHIYVYNGDTGKEVWEATVPKYAPDGLELIWNDKYYIASTRKGMICYDLSNGNVVWQTKTAVKMKHFIEYYNFATAFVLRFRDQLMGFDPNTGEVKWTIESEFVPSEALEKAGQSNIWSFDSPFGGRLLLLEDEAATLYDAATGDLLGSVSTEFTKKNLEPVTTIGDTAAILFFKDGTASMGLRDGAVLWQIHDEVDPKHGYIIVKDSQGTPYAAFGFKNSFAVLNMQTGQKLWETSEDLSLMPKEIELLNDSTLYAVGIYRKFSALPPYRQGGTVLEAAAFDLQTGQLKWGPARLVLSITVAVDIFGKHDEPVGFQGPWDYHGDLVYYVYANSSREMSDEKLKTEGGEGLLCLDPVTGEIKWRTDYTIYDTWADEFNRMGFDFTAPNGMEDAGLVPAPVLVDSVAYISTGKRVAKIDLNSGQTLWEGPDYNFIFNFTVADGRVFGPIGMADWHFDANAKKQKGTDVIRQTRRGGFYVLNAQNGEEMYSYEAKNSPLTLHYFDYVPEMNQVYLCDGDNLEAVNVDTGGVAWEMEMDKKLAGPISARDGVVFILTNVSSSNWYGGGGWNITTTKSFDVSMANGIHKMADNSLLIIGPRAIARVGADGNILFRAPWAWRRNKIQLAPTFTPKGILYQYKNALQLISTEDGSVIWQTKSGRASKVDIRLDPSQSKLFFIGKKTVSAITI